MNTLMLIPSVAMMGGTISDVWKESNDIEMRMLRTAQRRMLRKNVQTPRKQDIRHIDQEEKNISIEGVQKDEIVNK